MAHHQWQEHLIARIVHRDLAGRGIRQAGAVLYLQPDCMLSSGRERAAGGLGRAPLRVVDTVVLPVPTHLERGCRVLGVAAAGGVEGEQGTREPAGRSDGEGRRRRGVAGADVEWRRECGRIAVTIRRGSRHVWAVHGPAH